MGEDSALFLEIVSILLVVIGIILLVAGPQGFLTYGDMGILLIIIGFLTAMLTGLAPSRS